MNSSSKLSCYILFDIMSKFLFCMYLSPLPVPVANEKPKKKHNNCHCQ
ncbi:unnamed protein product [Leptidea sinapis]|uniref:Uncharacterized protein n=1 Tax=Leptidea sinapis TaxID=189913 RepID=A0A5E4QCE0_9NEOP|nr:unnamed protein product [Leptidea sinapis]